MIDYVVTNGEAKLSLAPQASSLLGKAHWVLEEDTEVTLSIKGVENTVVVPEGYLTDGATLPKLFYFFLPPRGIYDMATLVHDYLCEYGLVGSFPNKVEEVDRKYIDQLFYNTLVYLGMSRWKAKIIYWAIRGFARLKGVKVPEYYHQKKEVEVMMLKLKRENDNG